MVEKAVAWTFTGGELLDDFIIQGFLHCGEKKIPCSVLEISVDPDELRYLEELPRDLFTVPVAYLKSGYPVYPRFEMTLHNFPLDKAVTLCFNYDFSFTQELRDIIKNVIRAMKFLHVNGRYVYQLCVVIQNDLTGRLMFCPVKKENISDSSMVPDDIREFFSQIKNLVRRSLLKFPGVNTEAADFLNIGKRSIITWDEILDHPALWSFIERRAKISRIAHNLNISVHDLVGNYSWISMLDKNSELKEILQGSFDWNYSNTVNDLVRLFRNKLMHEDDDSMKQVYIKFENMSCMTSSYTKRISCSKDIPPLIVLRALFPRFYSNIYRLI